MPLPTIEGVLPNALIRNVNEWKFLLKEQGEKGLSNEIIYKNYTLKDKIKACKRIVKGETYSEVSRSIGMSCHSTVRRWYLDYMKDGIVGLQYRKGIKPVTLVQVSKQMKKKLTGQEKEEHIDLRKRVEFLEIENEYLKIVFPNSKEKGWRVELRCDWILVSTSKN